MTLKRKGKVILVCLILVSNVFTLDFFSFSVHGGWSEWIPYSNCTGACRYGNNTIYRSQVRTCDNPAPDYGGDPCPGGKRLLIPCDHLPECKRELLIKIIPFFENEPKLKE